MKTSDLLSADAPQQVKEDLAQVDEDLDAIFNHLVQFILVINLLLLTAKHKCESRCHRNRIEQTE